MTHNHDRILISDVLHLQYNASCFAQYNEQLACFNICCELLNWENLDINVEIWCRKIMQKTDSHNTILVK